MHRLSLILFLAFSVSFFANGQLAEKTERKNVTITKVPSDRSETKKTEPIKEPKYGKFSIIGSPFGFPKQKVVTNGITINPDLMRTWTGGFSYTFYQADKHSVSTEIVYIGKGGKYIEEQQGNDDWEKWLYHFLDINFDYKYRIIKANFMEAEIGGGLGAGILLAGEYKETYGNTTTSEKIEITDDFNTGELTWFVGGKVRPEFHKPLFVELRYGSSYTSMVKEQFFGTKVFNPVFQVRFGYSLPF